MLSTFMNSRTFLFTLVSTFLFMNDSLTKSFRHSLFFFLYLFVTFKIIGQNNLIDFHRHLRKKYRIFVEMVLNLVYWFYKLLFVCLYDVYMLKKVKPLKMFRFSQPPMSIFQLDTFRFFLYLMRICCQKTLKPRSEFKFQNYLSLLHFLFTSCLINSMNFPIRSKIHVFYPIFYLKENLGIFLSNTIGISH